ncbi:HAD-IB family phosphatase [Asticcacaulis sp. EMRT-3]|uniref:HAD-IB family phosphatase n=1 Tax=Asticcacaulis sp. EMRT-3 TaxID=3040349 RepID=UPI0024AECC6D|nr:HAD-IB family phosphatase [Asticcacaulis sp. EMRT-3]MDI7774320.1 HAD-IB family phosphatase [Asticcacaulis sp. EMRT-3]
MTRTNPAPATDSRPIVAFDFDGTLTCKDSFNAFLMATCGRARVASAFALQPSLGLDYLKTRDRGTLKSRLLFHLLGPIRQAELETLIGAFVTRTGMDLFRPDALATWRGHESADVRGVKIRRVIVTASPDLLVRPFGKLIGADRVIGTRLGFTAEGRLTPDLDGPNCRGEEKMCRLREAFGDAFELQAAYGDTSGDREMIAAAREGHYRVFSGRP